MNRTTPVPGEWRTQVTLWQGRGADCPGEQSALGPAPPPPHHFQPQDPRQVIHHSELQFPPLCGEKNAPTSTVIVVVNAARPLGRHLASSGQ